MACPEETALFSFPTVPGYGFDIEQVSVRRSTVRCLRSLGLQISVLVALRWCALRPMRICLRQAPPPRQRLSSTWRACSPSSSTSTVRRTRDK
jgi:hypothetical protein